MNFLSLIPFKKELLICAAAIALLAAYGYYWYDKGYAAADKQTEIAALEQKLIEAQKQLEAEQANIKTVVEYRDRIVEVEKRVNVYVREVDEIFMYDDSIIIPDDLARLHADIVCDGNGNADPTCRTDGPATKDVTLGEFSRTVVRNYHTCQANSAQLQSLIDWTLDQGRIYNSP